jgi:hypothetical protein
MSTPCRELALYLARRVTCDERLAYLIGPYTQMWTLLCEAIASITGETAQEVDARLKSQLPQQEEAET